MDDSHVLSLDTQKDGRGPSTWMREHPWLGWHPVPWTHRQNEAYSLACYLPSSWASKTFVLSHPDSSWDFRKHSDESRGDPHTS